MRFGHWGLGVWGGGFGVWELGIEEKNLRFRGLGSGFTGSIFLVHQKQSLLWLLILDEGDQGGADRKGQGFLLSLDPPRYHSECPPPPRLLTRIVNGIVNDGQSRVTK